jgi:hypothetical protein
MRFLTAEQVEDTVMICKALHAYRKIFREGEKGDVDFTTVLAAILHMLTSEQYRDAPVEKLVKDLLNKAPRPQA